MSTSEIESNSEDETTSLPMPAMGIGDIDLDLDFLNENEVDIARNDLTSAVERLDQLADWCEKSFKEPQVIPDRPVTLENAKAQGLFGSDELQQTHNLLLNTLNGIAENINVLALNSLEKIENLSENLDDLSQNVHLVSNQASIYFHKIGTKQMQALSKEKAKTQRGKKYVRVAKSELDPKPVFQRMDFNFNALDNVGQGGVKETIANEYEIAPSAEETLVPPVPPIFYDSTQKFATARSASRVGTIKRSSSKATLKKLKSQRSRSSMLSLNSMSVSRLPGIPQPEPEASMPGTVTPNSVTSVPSGSDSASNSFDDLLKTLNEATEQLDGEIANCLRERQEQQDNF